MKPSNATLSRSSPKGGKRGCLCKDGRTYNVKCCDGTLQAQGIGNITGQPVAPIPINIGFLLQQNGSYILQQDLNKIIITTVIEP